MAIPALLPMLMPALNTVLGRVLPDPEARAKAEAELVRLERDGELRSSEVRLSAILAEAGSADAWTSRARPTFLYVVYIVILSCMAGAVAGIWWPDHVTTAAQNFANLLEAIPESLWWLFGTGYLGYTGARSFDKRREPGR